MSTNQAKLIVRTIGFLSLWFLLLRIGEEYGYHIFPLPISDGTVLLSIGALFLWGTSEWDWMNRG